MKFFHPDDVQCSAPAERGGRPEARCQVRVGGPESEMSQVSDGADASVKPPPPNWISQHPAYQQMKSLEVEDSAQLHAAFLVYMDLSEVRQWKDVSCVKSPELQLVLLEGREKEGASIHTVLPLPVHKSLCHRSIRHVLDRGFPMLLCAVASDSTLVYQRMTDGLVTPDPPVGPFQDAGRRQHRKRRQPRGAAGERR